MPGSELNLYNGRLKINFIQVKRVDGATYDVVNTQMRVLHGSMDYNDKVGTLSSNTITGDLKVADRGKWYLIIDYATNNTCWLDYGETRKDPYVARIFGSDGDKDGFDEEYVELDFSSLDATLKAGQDKHEVEVTLVWSPARTSSIAFSSLTNATSISTSAYDYYAVTGYTTGFTEGDMAKLAKIELDFSASGNDTYPDSEYWRLTHLKLAGYTYTVGDFGGYDKANKRFLVKFGDQINHLGGDPMYYAKNAGTLWASYELKAYCKYPSSSKVILITMNFYFYKPDGSLTSAFARTVTFAS